MFKTCVIGASGYTGVELSKLLLSHPQFDLSAIYVSANSEAAHKAMYQLHGAMAGLTDLCFQPLQEELLAKLANDMDAIFLATPHQASHDWIPQLTSGKAVVFDLSGAFRLSDKEVFAKYYGFEHEQGHALQQAVYGLADWNKTDIANAKIVAVPGCYPTASLTALKPLQEARLLDSQHLPIINAVSGVSGAGRKAALGNSFCEVSLQAYGVHNHRHQPEISEHLGAEVIFTPHLGNFKRGILATITAKLSDSADDELIEQAYKQAYATNPLVRLQSSWPKLDDVVNSPYCDLHWQYNPQNQHIIVTSAIDNLLKGASSQALQCANINFGFPHNLGLGANL